MRSHRRWCVIFSATFSSLISLAAPAAHAQLTSPTTLNQNTQQPTAAAGVGPAYYQTPGGGQMPSFPPTGAVSPAAFNQFSNPGGPMQATNVQQNAQSRLRDSTDNAQNPSVGYGMPGAYRNTAMQQGTYPPGAGNYPPGAGTYPPGAGTYPPGAGTYPPGAGNYPPQGQFTNQMQGQLQGQMQGQLQGQLADPTQGQLPPSHLRSTPGAQPLGYQQLPYQQQQQGYQQQVVSSDPRFVMPPPVGNYATSPYRSPYRTVSYQLPQQSPTPQSVQPPSNVANQSAVLPNTTNLPQFQPTVGQLASYQALQPGYNCPPGIPSNGVPAFVPGAVVPPTLPPNLSPQLYSQDNSGYTPLFSLGQENYNVQLGRGIIGQPTVYVSGQPIRNFLRYLSP